MIGIKTLKLIKRSLGGENLNKLTLYEKRERIATQKKEPKMARTLRKSEKTIVKGQLDDFLGKKFFFRTVTYHLVGKVEKIIGENILKLSSASWIADSGRFMQAIRDGKLNEVEPVGCAYINIDTCTDFFPWQHELPTEQK